MILPTTFQKYTIDIKNSVVKIPDENTLFWGDWFCEYLFQKYGSDLSTYLSKEVYDKIKNALVYVSQCTDEKK